jgi:hypothetical protein
MSQMRMFSAFTSSAAFAQAIASSSPLIAIVEKFLNTANRQSVANHSQEHPSATRKKKAARLIIPGKTH